MAEGSGKIEFHSGEHVAGFLDEKPREWAEILAARVALRTLPLLAPIFAPAPQDRSHLEFSDIFLTLLRGAALPCVMAFAPLHGQALHANGFATHAAAAAAAANVAGSFGNGVAAYHAAAAAAFAAATTDALAAGSASAFAAGSAAFSAATAAIAARTAFRTGAFAGDDEFANAAFGAVFKAVSQDASRLEGLRQADAFYHVPLWHDDQLLTEVDASWHAITLALLRLEGAEDWSLVWIDWYEAIRDGRAPWGLPPEIGERIMVEAMLWPQEEWSKGAAHINRRIAGKIEVEREREAISATVPESLPSRREPLPPLPQPLPGETSSSRDFFVSYSHVDEAMAREVVDAIEGLGLSAFAQFRDMGPGANFVREMQGGLAASARVIALYSPEYEASHQCQAEWSAAYNADPGGGKRRLLPFLLRPTRLNPLAQQIVYKSLVGLSTAERRAAIIDAIEHRSQAPAMKEAAAELAAAASPDIIVTAAGRIDTAPNVIFDRAVVTSDLVTLPKRQQILCHKILRHTPGNTPPLFKDCFKTYGKHLGEPVAALVPGVLDDQWKMASAYLVGREAIQFDVGLTKTLELFAQNHSEIITHFPLREERERLLAETPIDEQAATGESLTDPIENVRQAVEAASEADQVTSAVVDHVGNLADRAEALAPPATLVGNEPTTTISARRRLVLTSLGFFERLYAAIGSTASVLSTETGRALYNAAREAADALMRFIR